MTYETRKQTGTAEAALILSDLKDRVDKLEKRRSAQDDAIQQFRKAVETVTCSDTVTVTEQDAGAFVFSESEWGFDEFSDTQ